MGSEAPKLIDYVSRVKGPSPLGTSLFIGLRFLDPLLQYALMRRGLGSALIHLCGAKTIPLTTTTNVVGLAPYQIVLFSMSAGAAVLETFWVLYISQEEMPAEQAFFIGTFNFIANSLNTLLSMWTLTSPMGHSTSLIQSPAVIVGTSLYVGGMLLQTVSEVQRKWFKEKAINKGKPYGGGLFSLATHVNYGGFTLWRTGYAMVSGGWTWATISSAWFIYDFWARAIPVLDDYCKRKYGTAYTKIMERVPYKLIPGVF